VSDGLDRLSRIVADRKRRVAEMSARVPGYVLRARLGEIAPAGRLERALRRGGAAGPLKLLCEIKRASPSRGPLGPVDDPAALARSYEAGGAAAISLVTEPDHFQGELGWFAAVRPAVKVPLLLKDFIFDTYQLLDAADRGADGVLLIAAMLSETQLQRLITDARLIGLDCLVEVHDENELRTSLRAGATLLGINNRNLHTFEIDVETSQRLLPLVPPLVTAVAESGIQNADQIARLRATRCDAVLIGEALMTSANLTATLTSFAAAARG
jgi:indole-3-glycerol phosphate synthase